ncbi:MAG: DUF362 domain-containing protein [Nitrospirae bacterium]|nr:DUF362 domain-containing protein [Nitrospirota bacterium]
MFKVIVKESSYEYERLKADVYEMLSRLEEGKLTTVDQLNMEERQIPVDRQTHSPEPCATFFEGAKVLIKPNLLTYAPPEKAITTHPLLVRAVAEYVLSRGCHPYVSDSPGMGKFGKVVKDCGLLDALSDLDVPCREFKDSRRVNVQSKFNDLELAGEALDADVVINLPKLKTHTQMGLTLAVKNLFGTVVGVRKPDWHFKIGENRELFAELLVTICRTIRPAVNVIDGILALEGDGPGSGGTPRHLGVLIASDDALSLDMAVCEMLDVDPMSIMTNKVYGMGGPVKGYTLEGEEKKVTDFLFPATSDIVFGPAFAKKFLRHNLTARPSNKKDICKLCNECVKICPAGAITNDTKKLSFDYDKCIRCYCCLEICPHSAIEVHQPLLRRALKKFL